MSLEFSVLYANQPIHVNESFFPLCVGQTLARFLLRVQSQICYLEIKGLSGYVQVQTYVRTPNSIFIIVIKRIQPLYVLTDVQVYFD